MISLFSNMASHGKNPPSINEMYPSLFPLQVEDNSELYWAMLKELMIDFAEKANIRRREKSPCNLKN